MKLLIDVLKPVNKANASVPLTREAAVRANYARIAAKRKERDSGWMAARRALCTLPCDANGRVAFVPLGYRIVWPYKSVMPDADNVVARMKNVMDGICLAFNIDDRYLELRGVQRVKATKENALELNAKRVYIEFDDMKGGEA